MSSDTSLFWNDKAYRNKNLTEEFKEMIRLLLQENPISRITMADLLFHPYMEGTTATVQ